MEPTPLWHVLVMDWTAVENTPPAARRPLEMQRWHFRVERLAGMVERPVAELAAELKEAARTEARRQRREMEGELAEDLAVYRAQGKAVGPPWQRRLATLAQICGEPIEAVEARVSATAGSIRVVEAC
ncbi:MAG TPA: hypothetical protein VLT32_13785 [Candidatus Sulfomarinibacteraceae bacterium]|jgi:hypothetical protein|nr:hypothetical protein [Candidatus Sulfomarinibacteraceae bacterium]